MIETERVAVHALALTDDVGTLEPDAEMPISTVLRGLEQMVIRKGGLAHHPPGEDVDASQSTGRRSSRSSGTRRPMCSKRPFQTSACAGSITHNWLVGAFRSRIRRLG